MKNTSRGNDTVPSNSRSFWEDVVVYGFCIVGIVFFLNAFRVDLFKTLTRQAEDPIGIITFKYKAAHRRFVDRVLWDRLRKESPVYAGDFIRTAGLSEATVAFEGGRAILNLPENSLIQLQHTRGNIHVNINEGGVGASAEASALVLVARDNQVTVETGSVVKAALDGGNLMLRVMEGAASFAGPGGVGSVSAGETVALSETKPRPVREAAALSPRPQARFLSPHPGTFAVPFRWSRANLPPDAITRLEVAEDSAFFRIAFSEEFAGDAAVVELEPGSYFWRVSPVNDEGIGLYPNILSFKILFTPAPALIAPVEGYQYQFKTKKPSVRFQWMQTEEAAFYILEVADNPEMANPVLSREVRGTSFYFPGLDPGIWHWRARPVFPAGYEGAAGEVLPASFAIVHSSGPGGPELVILRDHQGMADPTAAPVEVSLVAERPIAEPRRPEPVPDKPTQAEEPLRFKALPLTLLPGPASRLPEDGKVIGAAELRANRRIAFSWDAVTGATGYLFVLEHALTGEPIMRQGPSAETALTLDDLSILDVGPFVWRVEAVAAEPDGAAPEHSGAITRRGEIAENRFTIHFSLPGVPAPRKPGILYGKE